MSAGGMDGGMGAWTPQREACTTTAGRRDRDAPRATAPADPRGTGIWLGGLGLGAKAGAAVLASGLDSASPTQIVDTQRRAHVHSTGKLDVILL